MIDVVGTALTDDDRARLRHPAAGAVILFSRNYENPEQLKPSGSGNSKLREPELLVCVDHEGGRVQRFREGFTAIPPMRQLGRLWDRDREVAKEAARRAAYVIGAELGAHGVDFSFAPVLDLDYGASSVIGDRALHFDPNAVGALAAALVQGFADAGMAAVGKHFPGHGFAEADSHVDVPKDERSLAEILRKDVAPYRAALQAGLAGVMPAHVIYTQCDPEPAGYSKYWLQQILRGRLGFEGLIFSDDSPWRARAPPAAQAARARRARRRAATWCSSATTPKGRIVLLESLKDIPPPNSERLERMRERRPRLAQERRVPRERWQGALADVGARASSGPVRGPRFFLRPLHVGAFGGVDLDLLAHVDEGGTWTVMPVSIFAGLNVLVAVAFLMPGSVSTTVSTTDGGISMPMARPL